MDANNKIRDAFGFIGADEKLKASARSFVQEACRREEEKQRQSGTRFLRGWRLRAACAMLVLALGIGGYSLLLVPVSYVSIDVNPSIELELNRIDRVISARAYNEDGEKVLEELSLEGRHYTDAVDLVVYSSRMQPYLAGNGALTFTVASGSEKRESSLLTGIRNCHGCADYGGTSVEADVELVEEAHGCGLSLGKYAVYRILRQYDDSITVTDCHNMTMAEMHGLIRIHESCEEQDGHDSGNGQGNGSGHGSGGHRKGDHAH